MDFLYDDDGSASGSAYIFNLDGTGQTKITASDGAASDYFGESVGIGGTIIVVGAPQGDNVASNAGQAYIFDLSGNQLGIITASDGAGSDNFGYAVAVNDTKIAIGSLYDDDNGGNSGSVYLYNHDGTGQTKITASDAGASDYFGSTVAFNDTKLFVGSPNDDDNGTNAGAIYVYDLDGSNEVKVVNTTTSYERFAYALAASNSKFVVGASDAGTESFGAAYIFDASPQNTYLDNYTGDLTIRNNVSSDVGGNIILQAKSGENSVVCNDDGSVELYYDNNKKIETISTGATVTGDLYSSGSLSVTKNVSIGDVYAFRAGNSKDLLISHPSSSGKRIVSSDIAAQDGFGQNVAIGTSKLVVGARFDDDNGSNSGSAYIYDLSGDSEVKITASDGAASDNFGFTVGIGGTIVVIGAPYNDNLASGAGQAYIFDLSGNQLGIITASDGASNDNFGYSIAVGTSKIVVGAYNNDDAGTNSGSAYIYDHDGTNQVKITASDAGAGDNFGESVGIGGTIIVVGARYDDDPSNSGSVYIFDLSGTQLGIVTASDGAASDYFGNSVSVGGTIFVVGADGRDNPSSSGAAYIFDHKGNQLGIITASDAEISDYFGFTVAVDDTTIAVGAFGEGDSGAVYLYDHKGNNEVKITNPDVETNGSFGSYIAVNVNKLIVGIPVYDADGENAGSAFIYNTKNINGSYIENKTGDLVVKNLGSGGKVVLQATSGENSIVCNDNGSVELYYDNTKRLETISTGATVTGDLYATTLYGDGSNLTGISGGISNVVEDTTPQLGGNLDLNSNDITGTGNINITGVVTATSFVGDVTGDVTGNADTATTATNVTVSANNSTDETVYPVFVDGATGTQGAETDTGLTYNPSSGTLTATTFSGSGSSLTGLTGASAATYGNSSATPVITVDSNGRITGISTVATAGAGGGGGISNVVEDTTPQLGGNLDLNSKFITGSGGVSVSGVVTATSFVGDITGDVTGNADTATTATTATNVTVTANNSTDETVYPVFVDGATGTQGVETDTGLNYNPSTGNLTSTLFTGNVTGDVTGNADTATTSTNFTVTANNSTDETVYPVFVDGATGAQGAESDTGLTYNPSSGTLTATTFSGSGSSLTGLTGAGASTYGSAGATPVIVVDANGRITGISTAAISGGGGGGSIGIRSDGTVIQSSASNLNFIGAGITMADDGSVTDITIPTVQRTSTRIVASADQTAFTVASYNSNQIDVYLNGAKLDSTEFTETNSTTITLTQAASANDVFEAISFINYTGVNVESANTATSATTATTATTSTNVTVADESSDTTCFPLFVTAATGDLPPKSGSNLTFDSASGILGATTFQGNLDLAGLLKEGVNITAGKLSANTNIDLADGMVHLFTTTETATSTPNIRVDSSTSLDSSMSTGESVTVVLISAAAAAGYSAQLTIDGSAVTESWLGGSAPSTGGSSGYDVYTYNIIKTGSATFVVLANVVNFA